DARRRVEAAVLHKECVWFHFQRRKAAGDIVYETPVRRHLASIEQSRLRQSINTGANRSDSSSRLRLLLDPRGDFSVRFRPAKTAPAGDDQRIELRRRFQACARLENQTR